MEELERQVAELHALLMGARVRLLFPGDWAKRHGMTEELAELIEGLKQSVETLDALVDRTYPSGPEGRAS